MPRKHTCAQCGQVFHALGHIIDHANEFVNGKCLNVIEKEKNMEEELNKQKKLNKQKEKLELNNTKLDYNKLLNESTNTIINDTNNNKIKV